MGCTSSQCILSVTFDSQVKKTKQNLSNYSAARAWISSNFPELHQRPFRLQTFQSPPLTIKNSQDYISLYKKHAGELSLLVVLEKSKRYKPEIFDKFLYSIFKVRRGKEDIEATGFLLSPRLCLIGIGKDIQEYHALFEDGTSVGFKQNGIVLPIGEFALVELDVSSQWASRTLLKKPITLDTSVPQGQGIILYYSKTKPVLQEYLSTFVNDNNFVVFEQKPLASCTPGAPVFNEAGKAFAVYSGKGKAVVITEIAKKLEQESEFLNLSYQEAVEEALILSDFAIPKRVGKNESWANMSVFIDSERASLVMGHDKSATVFEGVDAKEGSSIALTPYGIVITGCDDLGNKNKAWLFNGKTIANISNLHRKHVNHSSIFFELKVLVVSGKYTSKVEAYDFQSKVWEEISALPSKKCYTSLLVFRDVLFMFGGLKSHNLPSRAIWKYEKNDWEKCKLKLTEALIGPGVVQCEGKIIVFGGMNNYEEYSKNTWTVDINTGEIKSLSVFPVEMVFGSYPTSKFENEIMIFSNRGEKVSYNKSLQKLVV